MNKKIPNIKDYNFNQKQVILQLDFSDGLQKFQPTLEYLNQQEASLIIIGSLEQNEESLAPGVSKIEKMISEPVAFYGRSIFGSEEKIMHLAQSKVVILENLGRYEEEQDNVSRLGKSFAQMGDFYINEAFGDSIRPLASINQIPRFLPACAGLHFKQEVEAAVAKKEAPLTVVVGGDDIHQGALWIIRFLHRADHILIGSQMADYIMRIKGINVGRQWPFREETIRLVQSLDLPDLQLHFPVDIMASVHYDGVNYTRPAAFGTLRKEEQVSDIGPETINLYTDIIHSSQSVVWTGALGLHARSDFQDGTSKIAPVITSAPYSLVGGEEAGHILEVLDLKADVSHYSRGGRSMMALASGGSLPGLEALRQYE